MDRLEVGTLACATTSATSGHFPTPYCLAQPLYAMKHIERLERKIAETEDYLDEKKAKLAEDPSNFAQEMTLSSVEDQLEQLQQELRQAKEELTRAAGVGHSGCCAPSER